MSKFQENLKIDCNLAPSLPSRNEKIEIVPKIEYNHLLNFPWKFYITQFRKLVLEYFVKIAWENKIDFFTWFRLLGI